MLFQLAARNLWRNRRRSLLTLTAMVVSSSLLILSLGIYSGMIEDMLASATEQYHGHLVVSVRGYQQDRELFAHFSPDKQLMARLADGSGTLAISPRLRSFGLLSHAQNTQPIEVLGIRPELESAVTTLQQKLIAGRYLDYALPGGALIGQGLAKKLGVKPGDELVFITQAADGSIGNDLLQVAGIFATGATGRDNGLALVHLPWLQQVIALPGEVHELSLRLEDPLQAAALASRMNRTLPTELEAIGWDGLLPEMAEAIATYDVSRLIMCIILYFAAGLGVLNTFFMSVMERTREFGIIMAMGMKPWRVRAMVLLESLLLGGISLVVGLALGLLMSLYMRDVGIDLSAHITPVTYAGGTILPRLRAVLDPPNFYIPAQLLLLICLVAGIFPANRAARLNPAAAIREE